MDLSFLSNFNWSGAGDWFIFVAFAAVAFVYGLSMGRGRLLTVMLGVYFSYFLTKAIPWKELTFIVEQEPGSTVQIFIFLALVLGFYFLIPNSSLRSIVKTQGRRSSSWWHILIFSFLQIGLIIVMIITFLPPKVTVELNPAAQLLFLGGVAKFLWLFLPILAMMFLKPGRQYDVGGD